ncbi:hypothetical protein L210DRAFT_3586097 [Boletus edulis BED1]|uniref:Uncharacterized protein n=1 Tax=Boletus edulis BED1 TaxID=1328754 RepID=A0AAD4BBB0_BOLED|nr:hypothetical protein L210DRAFT_3586097 [Boletus edulis BED1]
MAEGLISSSTSLLLGCVYVYLTQMWAEDCSRRGIHVLPLTLLPPVPITAALPFNISPISHTLVVYA